MLAMRACGLASGGARLWHAAPGLPAPRRLAPPGGPPLARPSPWHRTLGGASAARKAQAAEGGAEAGEAPAKVDGRKVQGALRSIAAQKVKAGLELTEEEARAYEVARAGGAATGARTRAAAQKVKAGLEVTEAEARAYETAKKASRARGARVRAVAQKANAGLELTEEEARIHEQLMRRGAAIEAAAQKVAEGVPLSPEEDSLYKATQLNAMKRGGKRDLPRGVYLRKSGRYRACMSIQTGGVRRTENLGTFDTPEEAARAFDEAAIRRWQAGLVPELVTNYPPEGYPGYTGVVEQGVQQE